MLENDAPSADEEVARLRLALHHTKLSTLVKHGFLTWDYDENLVKKGPRFDAITPLSDLPDDHGGELPDEYL
ncbi:transcriptional regulator [Haladaptatus pallidirubidus]|uniref:Uncharacterized protein n=1 Tax=Haladaptatus pallidirubidus TaxID=1008152 RepID=A0AAV3UMT2_9EURY|nr:hypothetical protein [Haladaptatus pallidirubidus]